MTTRPIQRATTMTTPADIPTIQRAHMAFGHDAALAEIHRHRGGGGTVADGGGGSL